MTEDIQGAGSVAVCTEALQAALARHGTHEILNTDQGSQFTSLAFKQILDDANVRISMDRRSRWMDNMFIERLWRCLKDTPLTGMVTKAAAS